MNEATVQPAQPQKTTEPKKTILDYLTRYIEDYVFLRDKSHYILISCWIINTYIYQHFDYTGYLYFYSNQPSCGKSRMLEILNMLVANPSGVIVSPTEPVLFRTAHGYTQILDEVDAYQNRELLRGVLNAGFQRGGTVIRMMKPDDSDYKPISHPVYAPRALAGVGDNILHKTLVDRTFMIEMERQTKEERRKKLNNVARQEASELKKAIALWTNKNAAAISESYQGDNFPYLDDFRDRTIDVSAPLAAILEVAYKDHPLFDDVRGILLDAISTSREDQEDLLAELQLIEALSECSNDGSPIIGNATELAELCATKGIDFSHYQIAQTLQSYGFKTKSVRKPEESSPRYRYTLRPEELQEVLTRYRK